ncbi:peptidylprolyl isomerase [uncultured Croceitalea sp.]|uniref:peptidylprolyl isomerase n=1 Tax=uncultured Croceitalea sp. TaxID=1798908 RepID=UPI003306449E
MKKLFLFCSIMVMVAACSSTNFKPRWTKLEAPETFTVRFETSKGQFEIAIERSASPKAVDRFYQLLKTDYFNNALFYRVNPGFVAQFGSTDSVLSNKWNSIKVPDEPVLQGNSKGSLSFARGGKETRTTTLFINLSNNNRLDTLDYSGVKGFPSFGKVTTGMQVVESLHSAYADTTMKDFDLMYEDLPRFMKKYPKLDKIHKVYIIKKSWRTVTDL